RAGCAPRARRVRPSDATLAPSAARGGAAHFWAVNRRVVPPGGASRAAPAALGATRSLVSRADAPACAARGLRHLLSMTHDYGGLVIGIAIGIVVAWLYFHVRQLRYYAG